jgi:3'-5' exoribonuclease
LHTTIVGYVARKPKSPYNPAAVGKPFQLLAPSFVLPLRRQSREVNVKSVYISEIKLGDDFVNEPFLMQDVVRRTTKDSRPYLLYTLVDKSGKANGVFWNVPEYIENWVRSGLVVLITARVVSYKDSLQINATDINPSHQPDMSDFLPSSHRTRDEMIAELRQHIAGLAEPWQSLVAELLLDDVFLTRFANSPAARSMHHAYIGGLLEHTLSMVSIANSLVEQYGYVNKDLLIAGILLHDMGKAHEYTLEGAFDFSDDGRLVGHIVRAVTMVEQAAETLEFPEDDLRQIVHLIASHHGHLEWGSPVIPKTLEAILLHQVDLLDSRVQGFLDHIRNDSGQEAWTLKTSPMFNTELRRPPQL